MKKTLVCILALLLLAVFAFASCEVPSVVQTASVKEVNINDEQHIIVTFTDGTTKDFGEANFVTVDIKDVRVTEDMHVIVVYSDDSERDLGYVGVVDESKNITVSSADVNEELHLIVTYSDGKTEDRGYVGVVDESKNVTVAEAKVDENLHLIVTYSNGQSEDKGYVGVVDESKNVVVTSAVVNADKHLIVSYSNGTSEDKGYVGVLDPSLNVTVASAVVNDEKHLIVTYSNGQTEDRGYVGVMDPAQNVVVERTTVNDDMHLIVTYSNGETGDLGYVGVPVEPNLYIVRFYDLGGTLLSEQEVYEGKAAKAPTAPTVADKTFVSWDADFTAVTSDMEIHPIYSDAEQYTVTFKDSDGTVLKMQKVISGHAATAPTPPTKENDIFVKWDKSFSKVTSNLTVTAVYRAKNNYTVTFKDYSGITLGTASVKEGNTAVAPVTPSREGYTFTGWSAALTNITASKTVTAQYKLNSGANVMVLSYTLSGSTLTVKVSMKGTVRFCGLEGSIQVPAGLTFVSATDGDGTVSNYDNGTIYFLFTSNNGKDVTSETLLTTLTFTVASNAGDSVTLTTEIADIYDQNYDNVGKKIIGTVIKLKA